MPQVRHKLIASLLICSLSTPVFAQNPHAAPAPLEGSELKSVWHHLVGPENEDVGDAVTFASAAQSASSLAGLGFSSVFGLSALGGVLGLVYHHSKVVERERLAEETKRNAPKPQIYAPLSEANAGGSQIDYHFVEKH